MPALTRRTMILTAAFALFTAFTGTQAARAEATEKVEGVNNFGRVTDTLYRGAQPSAEGFASLHHMGVAIIVNFRNDGEAARERGQVEALGMRYVSIPWSGHDDPNNAQIVQFLDLVRNNPGAKIFIHCQRGADRTGTMAAAYRVAVQHESATIAVAEMRQYHYARHMLPQLQQYINKLPQILHNSTQFAAYALPAGGVTAPVSGTVAAVALVH